MQVDHVMGAGCLVQAVDVLGDDPAKQAEALEPGDRGMTCVRKGPVDGAPSQMAACPVTAAISFRTHEHLVGHRLRAPRPPGRPAIVRDSRLGRDPCAAEYGDVTGPHDINEYVEPGALADRLVNCLSHLSMMRSTCWTSAMARAFGGYGERVIKPEDIIPAIKRGIAKTKEGVPVLLEFITSKETEVSRPGT